MTVAILQVWWLLYILSNLQQILLWAPEYEACFSIDVCHIYSFTFWQAKTPNYPSFGKTYLKSFLLPLIPFSRETPWCLIIFRPFFFFSESINNISFIHLGPLLEREEGTRHKARGNHTIIDYAELEGTHNQVGSLSLTPGSTQDHPKIRPCVWKSCPNASWTQKFFGCTSAENSRTNMKGYRPKMIAQASFHHETRVHTQ